MERTWFVLGSLSALIAVAAGAFGAHVLQGHITDDSLVNWDTAARYQMYHALALLLVAWAAGRWPVPAVSAAGWLFVAGTVLFAGSLYVMSLSGIRWLGAITPLGGLAFIGGWLCLAWSGWKG
ncbi:MAG: DUF423 domain-containing protein [Chloroflexota bacterium]